MVDKTSGKEKRVFEGGAMLLYLTDKYDKDNKISFDHDSDEYWETVEWIVWMQSGLGPMQVVATCPSLKSFIRLPTNRAKPITSTDTPLRRSSTASTATRPRPSVYTRS
jgi:glutathione S-transferase